VDCARSRADLYIFDFEGRGAGGCATEEGELEGDWGCGGVVLLWMGVGEVCQGEIVENCCCVAAVRYWEGVWFSFFWCLFIIGGETSGLGYRFQYTILGGDWRCTCYCRVE
jgi:hypothetical protein